MPSVKKVPFLSLVTSYNIIAIWYIIEYCLQVFKGKNIVAFASSKNTLESVYIRLYKPSEHANIRSPTWHCLAVFLPTPAVFCHLRLFRGLGVIYKTEIFGPILFFPPQHALSLLQNPFCALISVCKGKNSLLGLAWEGGKTLKIFLDGVAHCWENFSS